MKLKLRRQASWGQLGDELGAQLQILNMDVSENSGFSSKILHFNRVFHDFHHPFWGTTIFGNTYIAWLENGARI